MSGVAQRIDAARRYAAVFGRPPFVERTSDDGADMAAFGFPPVRAGFWRRLFAEAHDHAAYVTTGLSDHAMQVPDGAGPKRIELMALCDGQITGGPHDDEDVPTALLLAIADQVRREGTILGIGHTLDFGQPLGTNTEMTALLFTPPGHDIDEKRLCRCTRAQALLNIVPITATELALVRDAGVGALIDVFERENVRAVFDLARKCAMT